jgi:hypothetical protein
MANKIWFFEYYGAEFEPLELEEREKDYGMSEDGLWYLVLPLKIAEQNRENGGKGNAVDGWSFNEDQIAIHYLFIFLTEHTRPFSKLGRTYIRS